MSEYYGISTPSSDFFMHYGIKGMKWGVRKAIEKGNAKRLAKNYNKALKKLNKLENNANITTQQRRIKRDNKIAGAALGVGLAGIAGAANQSLKTKKILDEYAKAKENQRNAQKALFEASYKDPNYDILSEADRNAWENYKKAGINKDRLDNIALNGMISTGIGAAGLGTAAAAKGRALVAKYRTTNKGHAKAVAKRDAFRKEMQEAFNDPRAKKLSNSVKDRMTAAEENYSNKRKANAASNAKFIEKRREKQKKARAKLENKIGRISY